MNIDIITKEDLYTFKQELLNEIREIIKPEQKKKWLTSKDVRELLSISSSSLQKLRISGEIQCVKIGGKLYYELSEIEELFHKEL